MIAESAVNFSDIFSSIFQWVMAEGESAAAAAGAGAAELEALEAAVAQMEERLELLNSKSLAALRASVSCGVVCVSHVVVVVCAAEALNC